MYPLVKISTENKFKVSQSELKNTKKIFYVCTPEHGNIGDHAIAIGRKKYLLDNFKDYFIIEYGTNELYRNYEFIDSILNTKDIFFIHGGGNLGNRYMSEENMRRFVIKRYVNNKIISMPQTIYFDDTENGHTELSTSVEIYKNPNLLVVARDDYSFEILSNNFSICSMFQCPDMFLYYQKYLNNTVSIDKNYTNDIMTILREDSERPLTPT